MNNKKISSFIFGLIFVFVFVNIGFIETSKTYAATPTGTFSIKTVSLFTKSFSIKITGLSNAKYFKVYRKSYKSFVIADSTAINYGLNSVSSAYKDIADIEVSVYKDSKGKYKVAVFTLKAPNKLVLKGKVITYATPTPIKDVIAPSKPVVGSIHSKDKLVKGKAEARATIIVKANKKKIATTKTTTAGNFSVAIPAQKTGTIIEITATDKAGNVSKATSIRVLKS